MTSQVPAYVDSDVVKALVEDKSKVPGKDYLIIDVRDDDYMVAFFSSAHPKVDAARPSRTMKTTWQNKARIPNIQTAH